MSTASSVHPHPGVAGARLTPAEWLGYQLAVRPWLRRGLIYFYATHVLTLWALAVAPRATAATMNTALNWTGIADSHGVPIGAYFLSTVDTFEAISKSGPGLSMDPGTWVQWGVHAATTGMTHETVAAWIQAQASAYVGMLAGVLWLLRFSMSATWLYWLATWVRPIFEVLHTFLVSHFFYAGCLLIGLAVGAYQIVLRGHHGRGAGIMLSAVAIMIVGTYLLRDPITELYSDHGLLNQARGLGFSTAQAALNNGPITAGGSPAQLEKLTGLLVDALVREPLQIWNFGGVVDHTGTCASAWSQAILSGVRDAPAHAMADCGAPQALAYARSIDGTVFAIGLGYALLAVCFAIFVTYVSYSYAMVSGAAFLNAVLALVAAGPAMIHGRPRAKAGRRLREFFRHAGYVFVYTLYISFTAVIILKTVAPGGYAAQVDMNSPVATLVLIAMISIVATGVFRWLKKELGDHTRQDLTHALTDTYRHVRNGYQRGQRTYDRGRDLAGKARNRFGRTPHTDGEDADDNPAGPITRAPVPGRPPSGKPAPARPNPVAAEPHQNPARTAHSGPAPTTATPHTRTDGPATTATPPRPQSAPSTEQPAPPKPRPAQRAAAAGAAAVAPTAAAVVDRHTKHQQQHNQDLGPPPAAGQPPPTRRNGSQGPVQPPSSDSASGRGPAVLGSHWSPSSPPAARPDTPDPEDPSAPPHQGRR